MNVYQPSYAEWVAANRAALEEKFAREFGQQAHERHDYAEYQYALAHPDSAQAAVRKAPDRD